MATEKKKTPAKKQAAGSFKGLVPPGTPDSKNPYFRAGFNPDKSHWDIPGKVKPAKSTTTKKTTKK